MTQIVFTPGHCMVCEITISTGMFCTSCLLPATKSNYPSGHTHRLTLNNLNVTHDYMPINQFFEPTLVLTLEQGETGYVSPTDIYKDGKLLFILASTTVVFEKDENNKIAIKKAKNGSIEALSGEIDQDKIHQNLPKNSHSTVYLRLHLLPDFGV